MHVNIEFTCAIVGREKRPCLRLNIARLGGSSLTQIRPILRRICPKVSAGCREQISLCPLVSPAPVNVFQCASVVRRHQRTETIRITRKASSGMPNRPPPPFGALATNPRIPSGQRDLVLHLGVEPSRSQQSARSPRFIKPRRSPELWSELVAGTSNALVWADL